MTRGYIYILGSHIGTLCIGVTSNLYLRVRQHKEGTLEGFTAAYCCKRLLYFQGYQDFRTAIARAINPELKDLAQIWSWKVTTAHRKMYP